MTSSTGVERRWQIVWQHSISFTNERIGEKVQLDPDFREFVDSFVANDVRKLFVARFGSTVTRGPFRLNR